MKVIEATEYPMEKIPWNHDFTPEMFEFWMYGRKP
jgi:hypothetical protein